MTPEEQARLAYENMQRTAPAPSYSSQYRDLTTPREFAAPRGAVDLGTVSEIRRLASEEEPARPIDIPSLEGSAGHGQAPAPAAPAPKPKAKVATRTRRQPSLEEQARALQAQVDTQGQSLRAAPVAVDPNEDLYRYRYGGG